MTRIRSLDMLRGLIMALMALDHTRDFVFGFTPKPDGSGRDHADAVCNAVDLACPHRVIRFDC